MASSYNEAVIGGGFPAAVLWLPKTPADSDITLPLSKPRGAPQVLLSVHFHSKYTDHSAGLRKQCLCILAGGIYSERATIHYI